MVESNLQDSTKKIIDIANKYRDLRASGNDIDPADIKKDIESLEAVGVKINNIEKLIDDIEVQSMNKHFDFKFDAYINRPQDQPETVTYTEPSLRDTAAMTKEKTSLQHQIDAELKGIDEDRATLANLKAHQTTVTAQRQAEMENHQQQQQTQAVGQQVNNGGGSGFNLFSNNQKNQQRLKEKSKLGNLLSGGLRAAARNINSKFTSSTDLAFRIQSDLSTLVKLNDPKNKNFIDLSSRVITNINTLNGRLVGAALTSGASSAANSKELSNLMNAAKSIADFQVNNAGKLLALNQISQPKFDFSSSLNSLKDNSEKLGAALKSTLSGLKNTISNSMNP